MLALLAAGAISFLAGLATADLLGRIPCHGEGLACNIDAAVGAYGVIIFAVLGPLIYGVTLLVATNRIAALGAMLLLLVPILAFFFIGEGEEWRYVGFDVEKSLRTFLVMCGPPAFVVVLQYLALRLVVRPAAKSAPRPISSPGERVSR